MRSPLFVPLKSEQVKKVRAGIGTEMCAHAGTKDFIFFD
jgi:hypothetical protein